MEYRHTTVSFALALYLLGGSAAACVMLANKTHASAAPATNARRARIKE